jgi:hypothetical protein
MPISMGILEWPEPKGRGGEGDAARLYTRSHSRLAQDWPWYDQGADLFFSACPTATVLFWLRLLA